MKKILTCLMLAMLLFSLATSVAAQDAPILKLDRVVQISDTELVFEFSEPVVINKLDPNSNGPFVGRRVVDKKGGVQHIGEDATLVYLQWKGSLSYVDNKHDRILWTMSGQALGLTTIPEVLAWKAELADFRESCQIRLVIEEIPYNKGVSDRDGGVFNITTEDGSRNLFATHITGWESTQMPLEKQYNYEIDRAALESIRLPLYEGTVLYNGVEYQALAEDAGVQTVTRTVVRNQPLVIVAILGGGILLGLLVLVAAAVMGKKGGKVQ